MTAPRPAPRPRARPTPTFTTSASTQVPVPWSGARGRGSGLDRAHAHHLIVASISYTRYGKIFVATVASAISSEAPMETRIARVWWRRVLGGCAPWALVLAVSVGTACSGSSAPAADSGAGGGGAGGGGAGGSGSGALPGWVSSLPLYQWHPIPDTALSS